MSNDAANQQLANCDRMTDLKWILHNCAEAYIVGDMETEEVVAICVN